MNRFYHRYQHGLKSEFSTAYFKLNADVSK